MRNVRVFQTSKKMNPNSDGQRMLKLNIDEHFLVPWASVPPGPRPSDSATVGISGREFHIQPTDIGLKFTRLK